MQTIKSELTALLRAAEKSQHMSTKITILEFLLNKNLVSPAIAREIGMLKIKHQYKKIPNL